MLNRRGFSPGLLYMALVLVLLIAPTMLSRHILYQANLAIVGLDKDGYARLDNVPMEVGERYTIYLSHLSEFNIIQLFEASTAAYEDAKVDIFNSERQRIPNELAWHGAYSIFSESAYTIGAYTAQEKGARTLILKFKQPPASSLAEYKIVVRKSSLSPPFLLMFSDYRFLLYLIVAGVAWAWHKVTTRGRVRPSGGVEND